ncbi:MAG TPA: carbamoyltransferase [Saprospiraceae bacterium]|nr:carbamoyltransferase [Saprospiraceae bacterium]
MKKILGISAFYHDSAAALVVGDQVVAAAQEERFNRIKHSPVFPVQAIRYCLDEAGLTLQDLDAVVFYEKPLLKFERLLQTYYGFSPRGIRSFIRAIPHWINEKLFLKRLIYRGLGEVGDFHRKEIKLLFSGHHLSHAASAFYVSPFEKAAILTLDGVGEWSTATLALGAGNRITMLKELRFPHSVGLLYSAFTDHLGFRVNSGEYKLMGLAPYGQASHPETARFTKLIRQELVSIKDDGSIWLNQNYFDYSTGLKMTRRRRWEALFGFPRRKPDEAIEQYHCNLAYAIQSVTEEIILKMAGEAKKSTQANDLCLAGGVALNGVANGKLHRARLFDSVFIQPAAGDAGGALGAALAVKYLYYGDPREVLNTDAMQGALLGPQFPDSDAIKMADTYGAVYQRFEDFSLLAEAVADQIQQGHIIGWFQGRMEFGPRSLGNRSILADPRNPDLQRKINLEIKGRESFRPFAPSVMAEFAEDYFDLSIPSPYMLLVASVKDTLKLPLPSGFEMLTLDEKLSIPVSTLPAVTHVDFSARIQTVDRMVNPDYRALLEAFKKKTGCGVLLNTSFNVAGEPIVCSPEDAYRCFRNTAMDVLVIGNLLFLKKDQPNNGAY